jgi:hypothetical protein
MKSRFSEIARDSQLIPGVHHHCDEWCDYCPVTNRCLAYRCTADFRAQRGRAPGDPTFTSLEEAIAFTRDVSGAEGMRTDELDALVSHPPGQSGVQTSDPLAAVAWDYAEATACLMMPSALEMSRARPRVRPAGPTAEEIVLWYHLRIYMRTFRALVAQESACGQRTEDATGSAKLVLVAVERSRHALRALRTVESAEELDRLLSMLDEIERGLDERFPHARAFVRLGIDQPVARA